MKEWVRGGQMAYFCDLSSLPECGVTASSAAHQQETQEWLIDVQVTPTFPMVRIRRSMLLHLGLHFLRNAAVHYHILPLVIIFTRPNLSKCCRTVAMLLCMFYLFAVFHCQSSELPLQLYIASVAASEQCTCQQSACGTIFVTMMFFISQRSSYTRNRDIDEAAEE